MRNPSEESKRLDDNRQYPVPQWYKWGPYVSERSWGTVREDYSYNGEAWDYFPFSQAHKKTFRWGEDGIAGWCDRYQIIAFSPAFWNGKDPILKERLFGLNSSEGNHGEDVKECYYYLDATPSHSYMKYLYKYPQAEFPYQKLLDENRKRSSNEKEFELYDTQIFSENRYFDIFIEYAKASPEDICIKIEAFNRGPKAAPLHIIPQLWFRNQWSWGDVPLPQPTITNASEGKLPCLLADDSEMNSPKNLRFDYHLGKRYLYGSKGGTPLFTDNEDQPEKHTYTKDAFHEAIIHGKDSTNPNEHGTKACLHYYFDSIPSQDSVTVYLRLSPERIKDPINSVENIIQQRKLEADSFYETIHPPKATEDEKRVQRQALAGMLWTKQFYYFDVDLWSKGDNTYFRPPDNRDIIRNKHWHHLNSMRVLSMPDKWEYPWFAAWDLAFHSLSLGLVDIEFAKDQLWLLLFDQFQHANGAIPAYEWEFSDLNPPVQAWAAYRLFQMQKEQTGVEDHVFLKKCFLKLLLNFAYWVNKVDSSGANVFEGGFLGLDNITIVDRSKTYFRDTNLKQADGSGWMAMFCLNLMRIALELAKKDRSYESMATKFFEHFVYIADAIKNMGSKKYALWDDQDGFFYDVLVYPNGKYSHFRIRSLVGIIPLYAVETLKMSEIEKFPNFKDDILWFLSNRTSLTKDCIFPCKMNGEDAILFTLVSKKHLQDILKYVWSPDEFRSNFGLRSLSKVHEENPFAFEDLKVEYEPAESVNRIKGGNSNWRGPIWFPTMFLFIDSLKKFSMSFEDSIKVQNEKEKACSISEIIKDFADRSISIFTPDKSGRRPVHGNNALYSQDKNFKDLLLFYEYYHGDTGEGLGASHQTGWSGLIANIIDEFRR